MRVEKSKNSINVEGGFLFCGGWNFSKSVSVSPTFIREMRVEEKLDHDKKTDKHFLGRKLRVIVGFDFSRRVRLGQNRLFSDDATLFMGETNSRSMACE